MQRRYKWLLGAVVMVCAGWTGVWFYASNQAGQALDSMLAREASRGRQWTCAERTFEGFPFRFAIRCRSFALAGMGRGGPIRAQFGPVRAMVQIYNPRLILAEADGPVKIATSGDVRQIEASWKSLRASIRATRPMPERVSLSIDGLSAKLITANGAPQEIAAANAQVHMRPAPDVTADAGAVDVAFTVKALVSALADGLSGIGDPADAAVAIRITRAQFLFAGGPAPARLDSWRQAQGTLTLQNAVIGKGPLQLEASGQLKIDEAHRLEGNINTRTAGAAALMQRFGMPGGGASGLLGGLFAGRARAGEEKKKKVFLPLPLTLRDGSVWIGPVRTKVRLNPLY